MDGLLEGSWNVEALLAHGLTVEEWENRQRTLAAQGRTHGASRSPVPTTSKEDNTAGVQADQKTKRHRTTSKKEQHGGRQANTKTRPDPKQHTKTRRAPKRGSGRSEV